MEIPNHNSLLSAPILQPPQLHMHLLQYSHLQHPHQQEEIKDQHQHQVIFVTSCIDVEHSFNFIENNKKLIALKLKG